MMKRFLTSLAMVGLLSAPALAAPDVLDHAAPAAGGAAIGAVASGTLGNVAAAGTVTSAYAGFGIALVADTMINGNDGLWSRAMMGLCSLMGGEQSPDDNYQTCK